MQKCDNSIAGAKTYSRPRGFNIAVASVAVALAVPTPLVNFINRQTLYRSIGMINKII